MPKYPIIQGNEEGGWSEWLKPQMKAYKMACCDCGLVHELEFSIIKQKKLVKEYKDGNHLYTYGNVENPSYQVAIRARRHVRATAQHRRHKKSPNISRDIEELKRRK